MFYYAHAKLIDGCGLGLSERLLESTAESINEIEVSKSKKSMDVFEMESCVRGHHIYKQIWTLFVGEELTCTREFETSKDPLLLLW